MFHHFDCVLKVEWHSNVASIPLTTTTHAAFWSDRAQPTLILRHGGFSCLHRQVQRCRASRGVSVRKLFASSSHSVSCQHKPTNAMLLAVTDLIHHTDAVRAMLALHKLVPLDFDSDVDSTSSTSGVISKQNWGWENEQTPGQDRRPQSNPSLWIYCHCQVLCLRCLFVVPASLTCLRCLFAV